MNNAGIISAELAAKLIGVSDRHLRRLVADGWVQKDGNDRYTVPGVVRGYINFLKDENRNKSRSVAMNRVAELRARKLEQEIAEKDRQLIPMDEAHVAVDMVTGWARGALEGLPARATRDMRLRQELENLVNTILHEMADKAEAAAKELAGNEPAKTAEVDD